MKLDEFKPGVWRKGYEYQYFLPEPINHEFIINDSKTQELLERASIKLGDHAGAKQIGDVWAMFAGDADQDQAITMADYTIWQDETRAGKRDYTVADFRLDGRVTSQDYVYWYENNTMAAHSSLP